MTLQVTADGKYLNLVVPNDRKNYQLAMQLPAKKTWVGGKLRFLPSPSAICYIVETWPDAQWADDAFDHYALYEMFDEKRRFRMHTATVLDGGNLPQCHEFETVPYTHQLLAFHLSKDAEEYALLMEQGTGKTHVALNTAAWLYKQDLIDAVIVVAPKGVHVQWVKEQCPTHLPDDLWDAFIWNSNHNKKQQMRFNLLTDQKILRIYSFNVDAVNTVKGYDVMRGILTKQRCLLIVDESSKIKTPKAKRTQKLIRLSMLAHYRRILTGTPITTGLENFYTQFKFLSPWIIGHNAFEHFKNEYMIMGGFENREVVGYKNTDKMLAKIAPFSYRVTKDECLDLPDKIYTSRPFELSRIERKAYNEMRDEMQTIINDEEVTADIVITQLLRLQQIASGIDPNTGALFIDNPARFVALDEELDELDGQVIIWSRFIPELDALERRLAGRVVRYGGSNKARSEATEAFQRGDVKYFLANQASAGYGLDLTAAKHCIYVSNSFSLEHRLQSEDRPHRIGQSEHVRYVDLVADDTVDTDICQTLASRKNIADITLDDLRSWI